MIDDQMTNFVELDRMIVDHSIKICEFDRKFFDRLRPMIETITTSTIIQRIFWSIGRRSFDQLRENWFIENWSNDLRSKSHFLIVDRKTILFCKTLFLRFIQGSWRRKKSQIFWYLFYCDITKLQFSVNHYVRFRLRIWNLT